MAGETLSADFPCFGRTRVRDPKPSLAEIAGSSINRFKLSFAIAILLPGGHRLNCSKLGKALVRRVLHRAPTMEAAFERQTASSRIASQMHVKTRPDRISRAGWQSCLSTHGLGQQLIGDFEAQLQDNRAKVTPSAESRRTRVRRCTPSEAAARSMPGLPPTNCKRISFSRSPAQAPGAVSRPV